jgi:predicted Fe-S protein YdhL (DUF1289 family)
VLPCDTVSTGECYRVWCRVNWWVLPCVMLCQLVSATVCDAVSTGECYLVWCCVNWWVLPCVMLCQLVSATMSDAVSTGECYHVWCCVNWWVLPCVMLCQLVSATMCDAVSTGECYCVLKHHNAATFSGQQSSKNNSVERYVVGAQVGRKKYKIHPSLCMAILLGLLNSEDTGHTILWNIHKYLPNNTVS